VGRCVDPDEGGPRVVALESLHRSQEQRIPGRLPQSLPKAFLGQYGEPGAETGAGAGIADEAHVAGLVCLGYPFHPTGQSDKLRVEHLKTIRTPTIIVQGERDAFGNRQEVGGYKLSKKVRVNWLPDGDHSFKPRKSSGRSKEQNWAEAIDVIAAFVRKRTARNLVRGRFAWRKLQAERG
jgi:hypothetical protein